MKIKKLLNLCAYLDSIGLADSVVCSEHDVIFISLPGTTYFSSSVLLKLSEELGASVHESAGSDNHVTSFLLYV